MPLRVDAQRNRDAIVAAARTAFATGDADIRFDDFATLAGVGTGTLYRHFPTREDLAAAVYLAEAGALCDLARELAAASSGSGALEDFLGAFVSYLDTHRGLARALAAASGSAALAEGGRELEDAVRELVDAEVAAGAIRDDVEPGAVLIAMHGIASTLDRPSWRSEADSVIALLSEGLRRRG
jgi:AcrR family transcriptional regulator